MDEKKKQQQQQLKDSQDCQRNCFHSIISKLDKLVVILFIKYYIAG